MITIGKPVVLVVVLTLFLNSCQEFFTTSWGEAFKRDPGKVKVTVENVDELLAAAKTDPKLSQEILSKIKDAVKNATGSDKTELQKAAVTAAAQASGVSTVLVGYTGALIDGIDGLSKVVRDARSRTEGIESIADDLSALLTVPGTEGKPEFAPELAESLSESDLTMLVVVIVLGEVPEGEGGSEAYLDSWVDKSVETGEGLEGNERVAAAAMNTMLLKYPDSDLTQMLKDALKA